MSNYYNNEERKYLLNLSRSTIENYLKNGLKSYPQIPGESKLNEKRGVFTTIHKKGSLRGCIGYPLPYKSVVESVVDNSISAAFEDPRFTPLQGQELSEIEIEISILTVPQRVKNYKEVRVGTDGIIVTSGLNRGLFLPQVPEEQGWNLEEYISYGCLKAGLPQNAWKDGVIIEVFQAEVFGEKDR